MIVTWPVQLLEPLAPAPAAVTVKLSIVPPTVLSGIFTLRVAFPLLSGGTVSDVGRFSGHPELSATVKEKVFAKL